MKVRVTVHRPYGNIEVEGETLDEVEVGGHVERGRFELNAGDSYVLHWGSFPVTVRAYY